MYELTNMVVEEHVAKMDSINNKKTPSDEQTTAPEESAANEEIAESGDNLINGSEPFSLF